MAEVSFAATTPAFVGKVGIKARDGEALAEYYKKVVGLGQVSRRPGVIVLGAGENGFFEIEEGKSLRVRFESHVALANRLTRSIAEAA